MESTWITKTIYKNALKNGNVFMSTELQTRKGVTGYNVYIKRRKIGHVPGGMWQLIGHSSYWSDAKRCYHCTAWGTSRPLEIILSIGESLGFRFGEIKQNWTYL